jgi:hypothetical protein
MAKLTVPNRFKIEQHRWYGWQMVPGYGDGSYFSPIYVWTVTRTRTGRSELALNFFNAGYADGVKDFEKVLRVVLRGERFLFADIDSDLRRGVVISELTMAWLKEHCPDIRVDDCRTEPQQALQRYFGIPSRGSCIAP